MVTMGTPPIQLQASNMGIMSVNRIQLTYLTSTIRMTVTIIASKRISIFYSFINESGVLKSKCPFGMCSQNFGWILWNSDANQNYFYTLLTKYVSKIILIRYYSVNAKNRRRDIFLLLFCERKVKVGRSKKLSQFAKTRSICCASR